MIHASINPLNSYKTRLYYEEEQEASDLFGEGRVTSRTKSETCDLTLDRLREEEECFLQTRSFVLESYTTDSGVYYSDGTPVVIDCRPLGLQVRVSYKEFDGKVVVRDFYEKSALKRRLESKK